MMDAQPVTVGISVVGLLVIGALAVAVLIGLSQILGTLTGRQRHDGREHAPRHRTSGTMAALGIAVALGLFLLTMTLWTVRSSPLESSPDQLSNSNVQVARVTESVTESEAVGPQFIPVDDSEAHPDNSSQRVTESLPAWTQNPKLVVQEGLVGRTLFVVSSEPRDSEEKAREAAIQIAAANLQERLADSYPTFSDRSIPEEVFESHALKHAHTETWMETFGAFEEPMYRVYLQFEDSANTRQPIVDAWKRTVVDRRAVEMTAGLGIAALCLGTISAFLRVFLAKPGKRRGPVLTTAAFAAAAGAVVLLA